ncbi:MAG: hypothetical protein J6D34_04820 [Atopobiaceae bacterium]|nr:hypothetical protein [Atopobiaceae bacterium]
MSGLILYTSKYGSTEKYARWLSEATDFDLMRTSDASINVALRYDTIVFGGGVYASGIAGLSFLKRHIGKLRDKQLIVFCCAASPYEKSALDAIVDHNLTGELQGIPCFFCRGAFDLEHMSFRDRTLCKMLRKVVARKDPSEYEPWEAALMSVGEHEAADWTDRSYLEPILEEIALTRSDQHE